MIRHVAIAAAALWFALPAVTPAAGRGAPAVVVTGPVEDTLPTLTPTFTIAAAGFDASQLPVSVRLVIAADSLFTQIVVDTSVADDTTTIVLPSPLPDGARLFWRAFARGSDATLVASAVTGPRFVKRWLTLVSPNVPTGVTLTERRPTFVWSSAPTTVPPGPWTYTFDLLGSTAPLPVFSATGLVDTTFTPGFDLDLNTSYRWRVTARLASGDTVRVSSAASFVLVDPGRPVATLLYQNFPNPFPRSSQPGTCIWFDLRDPATVRLEIFDIRANLVRRLAPSAEVPLLLASGRYGRAFGTGGGCDPRFTWDGTASDGRVVAPGVYLLRLTANGRTHTRKMLFRGR